MGVIFRGFWRAAPSETPRYVLTEVTPPVAEPVTLAQAKIELRFGEADTYFDASLTAQIVAARKQVEKDTSQFIARATYDLIADGQAPYDGIFRIPYGPIDEITSVTIYDVDAEAFLVDEASYDFDGGFPARLILFTDVADPAFLAEIRDYRTTFIRFIGGPAETGPEGEGAYTAPEWGVQAIYRLMEYWKTKDPDMLTAYNFIVDSYKLLEVA
jgi:hypothetical protein